MAATFRPSYSLIKITGSAIAYRDRAHTTDIIPLRTVAELVQEGRTQRNCAAFRAVAVASGSEYLYRVEAPVRGTLSVQLTDSRWRPVEFLQAGNRPVDDAVCQQVYRKLLELG